MIVKKSRKYSNRKNTNRKYSNRKLKKKLIGGEIIINNLDQLRELVLSKKLYVYQVSQPRPIFRAILLTNDAKVVEKYVSDSKYTVSYGLTQKELPTRYFVNNTREFKNVSDDHVWEIYDNTDRSNPRNFRLRYKRHLEPFLNKRDFTVLYYEKNPDPPPPRSLFDEELEPIKCSVQ